MAGVSKDAMPIKGRERGLRDGINQVEGGAACLLRAALRGVRDFKQP